MEELRLLISTEKPDIIMLTEVIPKAQKNPIYEALMNISGYTKYVNFKFTDTDLGASGKRGIAIYVKDDLEADVVRFQTIYEDHLWIEVKLRNNDIMLCGCIYRSPSKEMAKIKATTSKVCDIIREAAEKNKERLLICGDFNYPEIDWENDYVNSEPIKPFIEALQDCYLHQHICNPTRYRDGQEPSLLDLILTTEEGMVHDLSHNPGLGDSDHETISFNVNCYKDVPKLSTVPNFYKADFATIKKRIHVVEWVPLLRGSFLDAYQIFLSELDKSMEGCVPMKVSPRKKKSIYMSNEALKLKDQKGKLWRRYKISKTYYDRMRYKRVKNKLRSLTRKLRVEFENKIAMDIKTKPKKFWSYVKSRTKTRCKIPALKKEDGSMVSTAAEKAELLNKFFGSIFTDENLDNIPEENEVFLGKYLDTFEISSESVLKKLEDLNPGKAADPDGRHPVLLKALAEELALPLSIIFQKSLNEGILPSDWLKGCVTAIFKKGDKSLPENYRPISITSIICRIMESLIRDYLVEHMTQNNLFSAYQHGFVPSKNCFTNLIECMEKWSEILESGDSVDIIYTDFAKAFDSVPHQRLLRKMKNNGITGKTLDWIKAFLSNRKQCVKIEDEHSSWVHVKSGIPQGSVLGPILFVIFINDMPNVVDCMIQLFADDAKLFTNVNIRDEMSGKSLQNDINSLSAWSEKWQLPFNISKCKALHIGNCNPCRRYKMKGRLLEHINDQKDLGVIVDSELKFHKQTAAVVKKANSSLGLVKKTFAQLDRETLPLLYKSLVRSHLEHGNVIWGPFYKEDAKLVEKVQRRATKVVPELRDKSYEDRLRNLNLPSLQHRRRRGDMIYAYKIMTGKVKMKANEIFTMANRTMRSHQYKIQKRKVTKTTSVNAFSNRIVNDWNTLPNKIITSPTTNGFKNLLDDHWKEEMFRTPF